MSKVKVAVMANNNDDRAIMAIIGWGLSLYLLMGVLG